MKSEQMKEDVLVMTDQSNSMKRENSPEEEGMKIVAAVVAGEEIEAAGEEIVAAGEEETEMEIVAAGEEIVAAGEEIVAAGEAETEMEIVAAGEAETEMEIVAAGEEETTEMIGEENAREHSETGKKMMVVDLIDTATVTKRRTTTMQMTEVK